MLEGFAKVLEVIANKISRKASIIALGMVLLYLLGSTPTSPMLIFSSIIIGGLAVFFTILQWVIDIKKNKDKKG